MTREELAAAPVLTESELETLKGFAAWLDENFVPPEGPLTKGLRAIIARHTLPKVEWVERGIFSIAASERFSLIVQQQDSGRWMFKVRDGNRADYGRDDTRDDRAAAKRAAEAKLAKLMRETK